MKKLLLLFKTSVTMKIRSLILFVIFLIGSCCYVSCVREVILDAGENPQVVVECILSTDDVQELYLNFTKGASKVEAEPLTEAVAVLIDQTDSVRTIGQFVRQDDDRWTLDYSCGPGHHYRLEVQVPGYDMIWAEDTMPRRIDVREQTFEATEWIRATQPDRFLDIPDEYAYYFEGTYYEFGEDFSGPLWIYGIDADMSEPEPGVYADRSYLYEGPIAKEIYTDLSTVDNFNVSEKFYLPELETTYAYTEVGYKPYGVDVIYPDLIGSMMHDRFIRINGGKAGDRFLLNCNFVQWWTWLYGKDYYQVPKYGSRYMKFMSVSDIYDQYLKTALIMEEMQNSSDMSAIYLRDNLPTNIHGGIGVFGGMVEWFEECYVMKTYVYPDEYAEYGIDKETHKYIED